MLTHMPHICTYTHKRKPRGHGGSLPRAPGHINVTLLTCGTEFCSNALSLICSQILIMKTTVKANRLNHKYNALAKRAVAPHMPPWKDGCVVILHTKMH